jgi:hypothetical protein
MTESRLLENVHSRRSLGEGFGCCVERSSDLLIVWRTALLRCHELPARGVEFSSEFVQVAA